MRSSHPLVTLGYLLTLSYFVEFLLLVGFGALEGFAMYESRLAHPDILRAQMKLQSFVVMKMFLSALGSSMIFQALFSVVANAKFQTTRGYRSTSLGYARVVLGCIILGVGMTLAGSGPTLVPSQLGAWIPGSPYVVLGCLLGVTCFSLLDPWVPLMRLSSEGYQKVQCVDEILGISYSALAGLVGPVMLLAALGIELVFISHASDLKRFDMAPGMVHPIVAGLLVGLNQIPLRLVSGSGQGGTHAYTVTCASLTGGRVCGTGCAFWEQFPWNLHQPVFVLIGISLGGYLACFLGTPMDFTSASRPPVDTTRAFLGGVLMLFGGKMARGCTCGRGITGFSEFSVPSILGTIGIFAGAMGWANLMDP